MTCNTCKHARPYPPHRFLVCRHPRTMAMQAKTNGAGTGYHAGIVFGNWCHGLLREAK